MTRGGLTFLSPQRQSSSSLDSTTLHTKTNERPWCYRGGLDELDAHNPITPSKTNEGPWCYRWTNKQTNKQRQSPCRRLCSPPPPSACLLNSGMFIIWAGKIFNWKSVKEAQHRTRTQANESVTRRCKMTISRQKPKSRCSWFMRTSISIICAPIFNNI